MVMAEDLFFWATLPCLVVFPLHRLTSRLLEDRAVLAPLSLLYLSLVLISTP